MINVLIVLTFGNLIAGFVPAYRNGTVYIPSFYGLAGLLGVSLTLGMH